MQKLLNNKKYLILAAAVLVVLALIAGGTGLYASLKDTSGSVRESLNKAEVTCEVNEDYSVTNTGNIPALIRVRVVVNNTDNGEIVPGDVPAYEVKSGWTRIGEYLYYNGIVSYEDGENVTSPAISIDRGESQQVIVLAEAIQAASTASSEEWGVTYSDGSWS